MRMHYIPTALEVIHQHRKVPLPPAFSVRVRDDIARL